MHSLVSICTDEQKTDNYSRKLFKSDGSIWWGMHMWQSEYISTGFIDSYRENSDAYQHWLDILNIYDLTEEIVYSDY